MNGTHSCWIPFNKNAPKSEMGLLCVHVEDLEELRNATPRAVTNGNTRKENHSVVVDEVLDRPLVERKAHVENFTKIFMMRCFRMDANC